MGPGAGERDVEMVAPRLGLEAAPPARACRPVGRHPVAELALGADEAAIGLAGVVPFVVPFAVDHQAHDAFPPGVHQSSAYYGALVPSNHRIRNGFRTDFAASAASGLDGRAA